MKIIYNFFIFILIFTSLNGSTITYIPTTNSKEATLCLKDFQFSIKYSNLVTFLNNNPFWIDVEPTMPESLSRLILANQITILDAIKIAQQFCYDNLEKELTEIFNQ